MLRIQSDANMFGASQIVLSIAGAQVVSNVGTELSFRLPMQESAHFPAMLERVLYLSTDCYSDVFVAIVEYSGFHMCCCSWTLARIGYL